VLHLFGGGDLLSVVEKAARADRAGSERSVLYRPGPKQARCRREFADQPGVRVVPHRPAQGTRSRAEDPVRVRLRRLDALSRGLGKELVLWQECDDPLLRVERIEYLDGIQRAYSGVEGARVVLAKAWRRLRGE